MGCQVGTTAWEALVSGRGVFISLGPHVTKSKLILLAIQQANKLRDQLLGQGIMTLFRKPADREGGRLVCQRTILLGFGF